MHPLVSKKADQKNPINLYNTIGRSANTNANSSRYYRKLGVCAVSYFRTFFSRWFSFSETGNKCARRVRRWRTAAYICWHMRVWTTAYYEFGNVVFAGPHWYQSAHEVAGGHLNVLKKICTGKCTWMYLKEICTGNCTWMYLSFLFQITVATLRRWRSNDGVV